MGMAVGGAKRGTFVEINIVPLIDVLLVLLVMFMIIPHRQSGLPAELPQQAFGPPVPQPEVIVVEVLADSSLRINQQAVEWQDLRNRLREIFAGRENHVAFIRGDGSIEFQVVARVIDVMRAEDISVGLMTPGLDRAAQAD
jgi:biopolymer transport protein ExbD